MKILINGAGIAGTTLAYWLLKAGHEVLLAEEAPQLRTGGFLIDFWGGGYAIAEKMGLIPQLKALSYPYDEVRYTDQQGRRNGGFSTEVFRRMTKGRFTTLRRSDLAAVIYHTVRGRVETRFGDSVARLENRGERVRVSFDHSAPCEVDLVVGADGLHSRVRRLVFGPDAEFEVSLGYHVAAFEVDGYEPRDELVAINHAVPGRLITRLSLRDRRTLFLFVSRDEYLPAAIPSDHSGLKAALRHAFAGVGWECPRILEAMENVSDFYFDRVSQIRMPNWTKGRTALIGDAAACVSLMAGEGTGLAMMEANVLAGELHRCAGEYTAAFGKYEALLQPFLKKKQQSAANFASSFVPATALGITARNLVSRVLNIPFLANFFIGRAVRDDIKLPDYGL